MSYAAFATRQLAKPALRNKAAASSGSGGLRIGDPNDVCEQEADRVADEVMSRSTRKWHWSLSSMRASAPLQRKCACGGSGDSTRECEQCKQEKEGRTPTPKGKGAGPAESRMAPIVHEVLNSPGRLLDRETRAFFERRFEHDFSRVRVHLDANATESARAMHAIAYTVGNDLVFGTGHYAPQTRAGQKLLAHELAHSIQQAELPIDNRLVQRQSYPAPAGPYTGYKSVPTQGPPPQAGPVTLPKVTLTEDQAFAKLHDLIAARIDGIDAAAANLKRGLTVEKRRLLLNVVSFLREGLRQAEQSRSAYLSAKNETDRAANLKQAAGRYQGMMLMATIVQLDATMLTVADWADEQGVPSGLIFEALDAEENDIAIKQLWDAARSQDVAKMIAALPAAATRFQYYVKRLDDWIAAIGKGAVLSRKVQKLADILLLAASIYKIAKIPTLPPGDPTPSISVSGTVGGEAAASVISALDVAAALEAIRKLIAIGALEPALIGGVETLAGGPGTKLGELSRPTSLMAEVKGQQSTSTAPQLKPPQGKPSQAARKVFAKLQPEYAKKLGVGRGGVVHHARELQLLDKYPGAFTEEELNAFRNMRGIPAKFNDTMHLSGFRKFWTQAYEFIDNVIKERKLTPGTPEYNQFVRSVIDSYYRRIDDTFGHLFTEYGKVLK